MYEAIPDYVFNRAGEMEFGSDEEDDHDGVADPVAPALPQRLLLTATGLASRRYTFEAESWEDALSQFHGLSTEELNAPTWSIWGIDLDVDVSLVVGHWSRAVKPTKTRWKTLPCTWTCSCRRCPCCTSDPLRRSESLELTTTPYQP